MYVKYAENSFANQCENNVCTSMNHICNLGENGLQCLDKYGLPNGLLVVRPSLQPSPFVKNKNVGIINDDIFDFLYAQPLEKSAIARNATHNKRANNGNKTRRRIKIHY